MNELRPCLVKTLKGEMQGLFHCWSQAHDNTTIGIVELRTGTILEALPRNMRFTDCKVTQYYDDHYFDDKEKIK